MQEKIDRDVTALRVQQNDLERSHSQINYTLDRVKHELETVNTTIQGARTSIENRKNEFDAEEKAMDDLRRQVQCAQVDQHSAHGPAQVAPRPVPALLP